MTIQNDSTQSPLQQILYSELIARINMLQNAQDASQIFSLLRPTDFGAIFSRAVSRAAAELSAILASVRHDAIGAAGAGSRRFSEVAPAVPSSAELTRELAEAGSPFFEALGAMEHEYATYFQMRAEAPKKAAADHSGFAVIGGIVGSLLGPVGTIAGAALGGYIGGVQLDEQLGEQGKRIDTAFEHMLAGYDVAMTHIVAHMERRADRFQLEVGHALEETKRILAAEASAAQAARAALASRSGSPMLQLSASSEQASAYPPSASPSGMGRYVMVGGAGALALGLIAMFAMRGSSPATSRTVAASMESTATLSPTVVGGAERLPERPSNGAIVRTVGATLDSLRACGTPAEGAVPVTLHVRRDGSVATVVVGAPYTGSPVAGCMSAVLSDVRFSPFRSELCEVAFRLTPSPGGTGLIVVPGST